jgi:hypothetical protein
MIVLPTETFAGTFTTILLLEAVELFVPIKVSDGTVVTLNTPIKVLVPVDVPVMLISFNPGVNDGTAIVPDRLPVLSTVKPTTLTAVPPIETPDIVSDIAQPAPPTVITVPTGPEEGLKVAVVTVTVWFTLAEVLPK